MEQQELKALFEQGRWYHRMRHDGLVSNGMFDIEPYLTHYGLDESYHGSTILDVGAADGFFCLLLKQRGADRVVAIDSNLYDGSVAIEASRFNKQAYQQKYQAYVEDFTRFRAIYESYGLSTPNKLLLMARLRGVDIEYRHGSIYNLAEHGVFDVVLCNNLLEHLRDPITAIEQVRAATRLKAIFSVSSVLTSVWGFDRRPLLSYKGGESGGSFYHLSEAAVREMCAAAGFTSTQVVSRFQMTSCRGDRSPHIVIHAYA